MDEFVNALQKAGVALPPASVRELFHDTAHDIATKAVPGYTGGKALDIDLFLSKIRDRANTVVGTGFPVAEAAVRDAVIEERRVMRKVRGVWVCVYMLLLLLLLRLQRLQQRLLRRGRSGRGWRAAGPLVATAIQPPHVLLLPLPMSLSLSPPSTPSGLLINLGGGAIPVKRRQLGLFVVVHVKVSAA